MPPPPPPSQGGGSRNRHEPSVQREWSDHPQQQPPRHGHGSRDREVVEPRHDEVPQGENNNAQHAPLAGTDARYRLNDIYAAKEDTYIGPKCFGPSIRSVVIPQSVGQVSKQTSRYDGTQKPDTWLDDYFTTIGMHNGGHLAACH